MKDLIQKNQFIIWLILLFAVLNFALVKWDPVNRYGFFYQNDFSKTQQIHPKGTWTNIFFGSSVVTAGYREDLSHSGFINLGMDYGKITDLESLLKMGYLQGAKTIVIGLDYMTFMDNLPTNPYYQWHREWYIPYVYFYRSPIRWFFENSATRIKNNENIFKVDPKDLEKELYHGRMGAEQLKEKINSYDARFGNERIENFQTNLSSLENVIRYCNSQNIELECLWLPINPAYNMPQYAKDVKVQADEVLRKYNIKNSDWINKYSGEYFYDISHISYEYGAPRFTEEFDKWVKE